MACTSSTWRGDTAAQLEVSIVTEKGAWEGESSSLSMVSTAQEMLWVTKIIDANQFYVQH